MKKLLVKLILSTLLLVSSLSAQDYVFPTYPIIKSTDYLFQSRVNKFSLSPIFGRSDVKTDSIKAKASIYGAKAMFDYMPVESLYLGADISYKFGRFNGHRIDTVVFMIQDPITFNQTPASLTIESKHKSKYQDLCLEARIGFNFILANAYATPYFIMGYQNEIDELIFPYSLREEKKFDHNFLGFGFMSHYIVSNSISIGVNGKIKWMLNKSYKRGDQAVVKEISSDSINNFAWYVELPLAWIVSPSSSVSLSPYYESRNYVFNYFDSANSKKNNCQTYGALLNAEISF